MLKGLFPEGRVGAFAGCCLLYAGLSALMFAIVVKMGIRTPVWPADAVVIALLVHRSIGDRLVGAIGALVGWLLFAWFRGGEPHFVLSILLVRAVTIGTGLWLIDVVKRWVDRSRNEDLFEVAASLLTTIFPPLASLAVAYFLSAAEILTQTPMPITVWWGRHGSYRHLPASTSLLAARPDPARASASLA